MKMMKAVLLMSVFTVELSAQCHVYDEPTIGIGSGTCYVDEVHVDANTISSATGIQSSGNSYQSFPSPYIDMTQGQTHEIYVAGMHSALYNEVVWIDFNNDSIYSSTEMVGYSVNSNSYSHSYYANVPPDAMADTVCMRVMRLQGQSGWGGGNDDACFSASNGEAEDYKVIIHCSNNYFPAFDPAPIVCYADSIMLFAGAPYGDLIWYTDTALGPQQNGSLYFMHLAGYTTDTEAFVQNIVGGCASQLFGIYITVNPTPVVTIAGPDTVQSCSAMTFDAGVGQPNYYWSNGDQTQMTTVTSGFGGALSCSVTNQFGCVGSDEVWASIAPDPPATYASIQTTPQFCQTHEIILHYDSLISPGTVNWFTYPAMTPLGAGQNIYITLPGAGTFQYIAYINAICGMDTALLSINTQGPATFDSLTSTMGHPDVTGMYHLCNSNGISDLVIAGLNGTVDHWEVGDTMTWNFYNLYDDDTLTFPFSLMSPSYIYYAYAQIANAQGCYSYTDTLYFTPANTIAFSFPDTAWRCSFPVTYGIGSVNYAQYDLMWSTGDTTNTITTNVPGEFVLTTIDLINGCTATDHVYIGDGILPNDPLHDTTVVCDSYAYFDITNSGYNAFDWWEYDQTWSQIGQNSSFDYTSFDNGFDTYIVVGGQNVHGCPFFDTTYVDYGGTFSFSLGPDVVTTSNPYTIIGPTGYANYMWSAPSGNVNYLPVTMTGTYTLTIDNGFGCTASDAINVTITPMALTTADAGSDITIYPNPASDHLDITSVSVINSVIIYDRSGRVVSHNEINAAQCELSISELPDGAYTIEINTNEAVNRQSLSIVH